MRIAFLVNTLVELSITQSTTLMITRAVERGHEVWVVDVDRLGMSPDDHVTASGVQLASRETFDVDATVAALRAGALKSLRLDELDVVLIRTNPGRDKARRWAHDTSLVFMGLLQRRGVLVLNEPRGLSQANTKLYLSRLPAHLRPKTLVSRSPAEIVDFVTELPGGAVLKPLQGTWGQDVFMVRPGELFNLNQIIGVLLRDGYAMVQEFIPEAMEGDTRIVLMDGAPLEQGGQIVAVRRLPGARDFRSNVSAGGSSAPAEWTPRMAEIAATIGPMLAEDGIFLAGLDLIGDRIVEVNVFSTGGFHPAWRYYGREFTEAVIRRVEEKVAAR